MIRMLFTIIACTITTFDVKAVDEHGDEVTPSPDFDPGISLGPPLGLAWVDIWWFLGTIELPTSVQG